MIEVFFWLTSGLTSGLTIGIFQATVGVIWPSDDPSIRRLQRICIATLLGALFAIAGAIGIAFFRTGWLAMALIGIAVFLIFTSALLGNSIERLCKNRCAEKDER